MNKDITVSFRMSSAEAEHLQTEADKLGMSKSGYIRKRITGSPVVRVYQPQKLLGQMYAIGNNINQIARRANTRDGCTEKEAELVRDSVHRLEQELTGFLAGADVKCP